MLTGKVEASAQTPLTAIVLTRDEEANLPACLESISGLQCEVIVVDSGSTDRTVELARAAGATCLEHSFESHAIQWQWAVAHLPQNAEWILGIDADQRLTPELREEISRLFRNPTRLSGVDGFYINRRHIFRGRWLRHGGLYPKYLLKLFRAGGVSFDERDLVDHHFYVPGPTARLQGDLIEDNRKENDLAFCITKHVRYAPRHASEEFARRESDGAWAIQSALFGTPDQRIIWLKQRWFRMPLYLRPFLYFCSRYVLLGGFLDGKQGFLFHFLQGLCYRLLVDVHLDELLRKEPQAVEHHEALACRYRNGFVRGDKS